MVTNPYDTPQKKVPFRKGPCLSAWYCYFSCWIAFNPF